jgi:hypothetical protein
MGAGTGSTTAIATIAAMITPAMLILASASLVATALVRMARIVDRARALAAVAHDGTWDKLGTTPNALRGWLDRHATRARHAERSIAMLYAAVVVFVSTCLSIVIDRVADDAVAWLPIGLAIGGTLLLLGGGAWMIAESRLGNAQIQDEIRLARNRLDKECS